MSFFSNDPSLSPATPTGQYFSRNLTSGSLTVVSSTATGVPAPAADGNDGIGTPVGNVLSHNGRFDLFESEHWKSRGTDGVVAWLDTNMNGVIDPDEPNESIDVDWSPNRIQNYVALGDSYSAGEGNDPYFRDGLNAARQQPGNVDNRCHRSTQGYAEFVQPPGYDRPLYAIASGGSTPGTGRNVNKYGSELNIRTSGGVMWALVACSGAKTSNLIPASQGGTPQSLRDGYRDYIPELDNPAINADTDLITVTIGGNDLNFTALLENCAVVNCNRQSFKNGLDWTINRVVGPNVQQALTAIHKKAPNARIIVLGYPQIFPQSPQEQGCAKLRPWRGEQDMLRQSAVSLNAAIQVAASRAGVEFADVTSAFAGHEVCGKLGEWIYGPSSTANFWDRFVDNQTFHPNLLGQREGYAKVVNARISG